MSRLSFCFQFSVGEMSTIHIFLITLENTEGAIKNGQSRETDNRGHTRRRKITQIHNTICVGHHYVQANTNNVSKTWALLQTTGDKDEPNMLNMCIFDKDKEGLLSFMYTRVWYTYCGLVICIYNLYNYINCEVVSMYQDGTVVGFLNRYWHGIEYSIRLAPITPKMHSL